MRVSAAELHLTRLPEISINVAPIWANVRVSAIIEALPELLQAWDSHYKKNNLPLWNRLFQSDTK